jgi:hypothetical protein
LYDIDGDGVISSVDLLTVKRGFPANSLIGKELGILDNHIVENQLRRNNGGVIPDS